jgi:tetratricopeptide (TPR) repeat protein
VVVATLALLVTIVLGLFGYRVLDREYRYQELVKLGDDLLADGFPLEATKTYAAAVSLKPREPIAYVKRSDAHRSRGDLGSARTDLETADSLSDDVLLVATRLADLCYETGKLDEAARNYEKVLSIDPESPAVLYKLGLIHFRSGRDAEALDALGRAATLHGFWQAYYLRGAVFRSIGGKDEAERDFLRAVELAPDAELPRSALIELYLEERSLQEALPLVRDEIDENPGRAEPYLHLAEIHRLSGRTAEAIEAVSRALEQNPDLPAAYLRLGELWLEEAGRRDDTVAAEKAVAALTNVAKMDPASGAAALALGRAYLALGDEARGFAELERASSATPLQAEALQLLGDLYRARNNAAEAVTVYHVYLKLSGDTPAVLERLGDAYVESGKPHLAAETYLRLSALEPRRASHIVKAAQSFLESEDPEAAARACRVGLAANPENRVLLDLLAEARRGVSRTRRTDPSSSS